MTTGRSTGHPGTACTPTGRRTCATPYPGGESWQQAVDRVGSFLGDLLPRWDGARVLVVGHVATRLGLDHHLLGVPLVDALAEEFRWQPGWEYTLESP